MMDFFVVVYRLTKIIKRLITTMKVHTVSLNKAVYGFYWYKILNEEKL